MARAEMWPRSGANCRSLENIRNDTGTAPTSIEWSTGHDHDTSMQRPNVADGHWHDDDDARAKYFRVVCLCCTQWPVALTERLARTEAQ
jgi:hypothetical protein